MADRDFIIIRQRHKRKMPRLLEQCSLRTLPLVWFHFPCDLRCVAIVLHRLRLLLPIHCSYLVRIPAMVRLPIEALGHLIRHRPCAPLLVALHWDVLVRLSIRARIIRACLHGRVIRRLIVRCDCTGQLSAHVSCQCLPL